MDLKKKIVRKISKELEFTNGWKISNEDYEERCNKIADYIIGQLGLLVIPTTANTHGFLYELEQKFLELKSIQGGNKWAEGYDEYIAVANLRNFYITKVHDKIASRCS